jgi:hypothetical protein
VAPAVGFAIPDAGENLLLRLLAKAVERGDRALLHAFASAPMQAMPSRSCSALIFRTESGTLQQLNQPGFDRRLERFEYSSLPVEWSSVIFCTSASLNPFSPLSSSGRDQPRKFGF